MSLYREGWLSKHEHAVIGSIHEPVQGGVVKQARACSNIGSITYTYECFIEYNVSLRGVAVRGIWFS